MSKETLVSLVVVLSVLSVAKAGVATCDQASTGTSSFLEFEGLCIGYYSFPSAWHDAQIACRSRGGELAIPRSNDMNEAIWSLTTDGPTRQAWIGVHDMHPTTEARYVGAAWGDLETPVLLWDDNEPNNSGNEDCVHTRDHTARWNDLECSALLPGYFCEFPIFQDVDSEAACLALGGTALVTESAYADGECVFIPFDGKNWAAADEYCGNFRRGGEPARLVKVDTEATNNLIRSLARSTFNRNPWIGGHDMDQEGDFFWVADGSAFSCGFTNWHPGEPNDLAGEDCVEFLSGSVDGQWNDLGCEIFRPYVCGWPGPDSCDTHVFATDCDDVVVDNPGYDVRLCFSPNGLPCDDE